MLFCSYEFVFLFLPIVMVGYFLIANRTRVMWARTWLVAASLLFYGWFKPWYLLIIVSSILVNYACVYMLERLKLSQPKRLVMMWAGIIFDLGLLGYFKYSMFVLANINLALNTHFPIFVIVLPLGISFFTFQQISCLVDLYKSRDEPRYTLLNYSLFVTFFPQLVAGPIVHHHDMMPQFDLPEGGKPNYLNLSAGLHLFAVGLFKKLVIADFLGAWARNGMDTWEKLPELTFWQAWFSVLAYVFQLYFDFSAYSDMAIGLGRMFNIHLPLNFNSPYRSCSIQEFWRRWHMTLGNFLMHYVYFPLGGSRKGETRACVNLFVVFLVCGIWHAANWPFVVFGALHGLAMVANRCWSRLGLVLPKVLGWTLTFAFIVVTYVLVRCTEMARVFRIWRGMFSLPELNWKSVTAIAQPVDMPWLYLLGALLLVLCFPNSSVRNKHFQPTLANGLATVTLLVVAVLHMSRISPFLYFNF